MMAKRKKKPVITNFKVGDKVRVKQGITDVEYPDMPMGGWAGAISEIHKGGMYTVQWSQETLAAIHPVFKTRCERDGTSLEEYWLSDDDLEPDTGEPLDIEHPKEIKTRPLSQKDQDDRIRMALGLTSNDPLSDVDSETLVRYHDYLLERLSFPFDAEYTSETGPFSSTTIPVKVTGLGDPDEPMIDDSYGIICRTKHERAVRITLMKAVLRRSQNRRWARTRIHRPSRRCLFRNELRLVDAHLEAVSRKHPNRPRL
jgi:hypothetical protein